MGIAACLCFVLLAAGEQGIDLDPGAGAGEFARTLDARLTALSEVHAARGTAATRALATQLGIDLDAALGLDLDVVAHDGAPLAASTLEGLGVHVVQAGPERTWIRATLAQALALRSALPLALDLRVPTPVATFSTSEGVALTGAGAAHALGATGAGCRVAIIDAGFTGLAGLVLAGALPVPFKEKDYTASGLEHTTDHGAAVALVVHEMAPDASLILIKIANLTHFQAAVDYAIQKNADVICAAIGFVGANFSDGSGAAAAAVAKARNKGVLPVVAAGNFGDKHWIGAWKDKDADKLLEFAPADEGLTFQAQSGDAVTVTLVWDDFPSTNKDLALTIHHLGTDGAPQAPAPNNLMAKSDVIQNGFQAPLEVAAFQAPASGNYAAFVRRNGSAPQRMALFLSHAVSDGNGHAKSSIATPADAGAALTVGAAPAATWTLGPVSAFSSQGPTTHGKAKPDLLAPSGVTNAVLLPFSGTSAACPHVAGAACVLKSAQPTLGVDALEQRLRAYALPYADMGPNVQGAGRLDLGGDFFAPLPDPAAFDAPATQIGANAITLHAAVPADQSPPIQYRFLHLGKKKQGGSSSAWQTDPGFTDDDLQPDRVYRYRLLVRDSALFENVNQPSDDVLVRTHAATPPPPKVEKAGSSFVRLKLLPGANKPSVDLALYCVTLGSYVAPDGALIGPEPQYRAAKKWPSVQLAGLAALTPYEFRTRARNGAGVETELSDPAFAVTAP